MNKELNMLVGQRIRAQREMLGYSREFLANITDVSPQFISELERGIKGCSTDTLYKLCTGLSVSADYILFGEDRFAKKIDLQTTLMTLGPQNIEITEQILKLLVKLTKT